jgi:hypothetical protein
LNARRVVAGLAFALILFLAYLTVRVMIDDGFDFLVLISLVILAVLGFGVLGALGSSPDE